MLWGRGLDTLFLRGKACTEKKGVRTTWSRMRAWGDLSLGKKAQPKKPTERTWSRVSLSLGKKAWGKKAAGIQISAAPLTPLSLS